MTLNDRQPNKNIIQLLICCAFFMFEYKCIYLVAKKYDL